MLILSKSYAVKTKHPRALLQILYCRFQIFVTSLLNSTHRPLCHSLVPSVILLCNFLSKIAPMTKLQFKSRNFYLFTINFYLTIISHLYDYHLSLSPPKPIVAVCIQHQGQQQNHSYHLCILQKLLTRSSSRNHFK